MIMHKVIQNIGLFFICMTMLKSKSNTCVLLVIPVLCFTRSNVKNDKVVCFINLNISVAQKVSGFSSSCYLFSLFSLTFSYLTVLPRFIYFLYVSPSLVNVYRWGEVTALRCARWGGTPVRRGWWWWWRWWVADSLIPKWFLVYIGGALGGVGEGREGLGEFLFFLRSVRRRGLSFFHAFLFIFWWNEKC